jgi:hypothetical protein
LVECERIEGHAGLVGRALAVLLRLFVIHGRLALMVEINDTRRGVDPELLAGLLLDLSPRVTSDAALREIDGPIRQAPSRRGDWESRIPDQVVKLWGELSTEAKVVAYVIARTNMLLED